MQCCGKLLLLYKGKALAKDPSASLEDWNKLARTGEIVWFYNGKDRKKTCKILRNGYFGTVSF